MSKVKRTLGPAPCFLLGLAGLLGLHSEFAIIAVEEFLFSKKYNKFSITESVTHWIVVFFLWGLLALVLYYIAARVYGYDLIKKSNKPSVRGLVIALLLLSSSIGVKYILLGSWQMVLDFKQQGWFQFIFLYLYHLFEAALLLLSAAFFQEGCEKLTKIRNEHIPWGGLILALTWGLSHFITTGSVTTALFYTAVAFFIGSAYLAARKNLYFAYLFSVVLIAV